MFDSDTLALVLTCTRDRLLAWTREAPNVYVSKRVDLEFRIEFQRALLADETTSGADIVQVTCGALCLT